MFHENAALFAWQVATDSDCKHVEEFFQGNTVCSTPWVWLELFKFLTKICSWGSFKNSELQISLDIGHPRKNAADLIGICSENLDRINLVLHNDVVHYNAWMMQNKCIKSMTYCINEQINGALCCETHMCISACRDPCHAGTPTRPALKFRFSPQLR